MTSKEYRKKYYAANREKQLRYNAKWRAANPQKVQAQGARARAKNPEKQSARNKAYRKANPDKGRALNAKRYACKMRAIPKWANFTKIDSIYAEAYILDMHVDHIVPLRHPRVCGLHWEENLRPLEAIKNHSKGNRFWPDM